MNEEFDTELVGAIECDALFRMLLYYTWLSQAASCLAFVGGVCESARDIIAKSKVRDDMLQCILAVDAAVQGGDKSRGGDPRHRAEHRLVKTAR